MFSDDEAHESILSIAYIHAAALRSRANLDFLLSGDAKSLEARNDRLMKQLASVVGQTAQSLTETRVFPLHQERCGTAKMDVAWYYAPSAASRMHWWMEYTA
ncbi:hypothetical protein FPANT_4637 [Fusarium pseudoanthophilum]|uniref:Uncharacterized protein n=1 Tax=Fusarium pseudoanthophilum TaxID=48495 RepID=A0A8H5PFD0_9HYPO|nr:hypothetical protein FPANT_4637 [Fusarium pseudoanthophilum]